MASHPPPPPAAPTTISNLGDDLVREIFLRLPDLPSLVRAAFACHTFRRAVRSSPAFRRSFCALHAPPLVALFLEPNMEAVPVLPSRSRHSDPALLAADFFGIRLLRHDDPSTTGWEIESWRPSADGYLILELTGSTRLKAAYSPIRQALDLSIYEPYIHFEFHKISSQDGQVPARVVCVRRERRSAESTAFFFSSDTMEWQISQRTTLRLREPDGLLTCTVVRGLICWRGWMYDRIVALGTVTCQFYLIDLPAPLKLEWDRPTYMLGETKDGKFCIVDIQDNTLVSWFMATNHDERWMVYTKLSLHQVVKEFAGCEIDEDGRHVSVDLVALISGYVYFSIFYYKDTTYCFEVYLSVCLETSEITELFEGPYRHNEEAHPYVMAWPPSLVQSKEESETEFTGDSVADNRPVCTEEDSTLLVTALQSFSQALMNHSDNNNQIVAELDVFLRSTEDEKGSLISKMTTLDAQLRTARDHILKIRA